MISRKNIHGTQEVKPSTVEINMDAVYIRSGIRQESVDMGDGVMADMWVYDEDQLDRSEYDQLLALTLVIPSDAWNEGLQTASREARYKRMDGPEQSTRRRIELGIDVEANQIKLNKILNYKQAVYETVNQEGYPHNVPVYPPEPEI